MNNIEDIIEKGSLKHYVERNVERHEDAEDILQDIYYCAFKSLSITNRPIEYLSAWLFRIAKNMLINRKRRMREIPFSTYVKDQQSANKIMEIVVGTEGDNPEMEYLRSCIWDELDFTLDILPKEQKEAFILTEYEGKSIQMAAEITGVSVNTLLSRKHYAVIKLRKHLQHLYDDLTTNF